MRLASNAATHKKGEIKTTNKFSVLNLHIKVLQVVFKNVSIIQNGVVCVQQEFSPFKIHTAFATLISEHFDIHIKYCMKYLKKSKYRSCKLH